VSDAPVLVCESLCRSFDGQRAVDDLSFRIEPGETYGLLGPNGAGKTTTIRMICGLLRHDAGSITIAGRHVDDHDVGLKHLVGYVPQDVALYPDLSARENLRFFGRLQDMSRRDLGRRVEEVLDVIDLRERGDDRVDSYSGGMKRRLNIGVGLLHQPALLVLDEPTVGVDPQSRHAILESVRRFRAAGMAVLYTTHYMEEAEHVCDRVGVIDHGRLIAEGTRRELVALVEERDRIELAASGDLDNFVVACRGLDGVDEASRRDGEVQVLAHDARRLLPDVLMLAEQSGAHVRSVQVVEPDLETVFLHLTGTALRE
jgi:ABC-2 type transport system ATP-binding protein